MGQPRKVSRICSAPQVNNPDNLQQAVCRGGLHLNLITRYIHQYLMASGIK
jgi:hypothetical protein